jgi:hypothetical protein
MDTVNSADNFDDYFQHLKYTQKSVEKLVDKPDHARSL